MKIATNIARYLLALLLLVFGSNKFLGFMEMPPMPEEAQAYLSALGSTGVLFPLLGVIYIITAITLLADRFAALLLLILAPVAVNILLFHATLAPSGIGPGIILTVLLILTMIRYKPKYEAILQAK